MRKIFIFAMIITLAAVMAACGNGSSKKPEDAAVTPKDGESKPVSSDSGKVTLTYGVWGAEQVSTMEQLAKKFSETHPDIEVKVELTPWDLYWSKLETAAIGETLPDVFWMNALEIIKYASNGILLPITDQIKADNVDMNNYPESLVSLYTVDGQNYGMPKDYDTRGLFYNKKLFDEKNLEYPNETWDWNKVIETAQKLTDPAKGVWGIAAQLSNQASYYNSILQAGGYVISDDKKSSGYDKPEAIAGLKYWTDLINVYKVSPTLAQMTDTDPLVMLKSGKVAMLQTGPWTLKEIASDEYAKDVIDVAPLPMNKQRAVVIHGLANVISAKAGHPKEAWEFVKFLGSKEAADIQANTGTVIPAFKGTEQAWLKAFPNVNAKIFIDQLAIAKPFPVSKQTSAWEQQESKILSKAWTGEITAEAAGKELAKVMNDALAKEK